MKKSNKKKADGLLFVDGTDHKQVAWAIKKFKTLNTRYKIFTTKGSAKTLSSIYQTRIYMDENGNISKRLKITALPAVVELD